MCEGFIKFFEVKEKQLKQTEKNNNEERMHTYHGIQVFTYWNKLHFKKNIYIYIYIGRVSYDIEFKSYWN